MTRGTKANPGVTFGSYLIRPSDPAPTADERPQEQIAVSQPPVAAPPQPDPAAASEWSAPAPQAESAASQMPPQPIAPDPVSAFPVGPVAVPFVSPQARINEPLRLQPVVITTAAVAFLTFVLGILTALTLARGPGTDVAQTAPSPPLSPPGAQTVPAPDASAGSFEALVAASLEQEVTRAQSDDLLVPSTMRTQTDRELDAIRAGVLQGLQPKRTLGSLTEAERQVAAQQALAIIGRNKLRMLREGVLAGVYSVETRQEGDAKQIVLKTVNADMTGQNIANVLQQAEADGLIDLTSALRRPDGTLDKETMVFNLVQASLANDGTEAGAEAAREMSRRAFAAAPAQTQRVRGERIYVVEPGDSLAYISLQFYGRPNDYDRIFQANREILTSPDRIQIGQRLIIPG
ncbi:MAG: LysM peptidoglycan-binding domain-containing protein [Pseudomonadota bacterium]